MWRWVIPVMWAVMRTLAFIFQLVGLGGLIVIALALMFNKLFEEEGNENQL